MAKSEIILKFDNLIDNVDFNYDENNGLILIDSNHFTGFELVKEKDKKEEK